MIAIKTIQEGDGWMFLVQVHEGNSMTQHRVSLSANDYNRLTKGRIPPDECIRKSFEFLLEREAKESILREFDVMKIALYFPEYPQELGRRIAGL